MRKLNLRELTFISELPVYERPTRQKKNKVKIMHMFLFKSANDNVQSDTTSISEVKWVPFDEIEANEPIGGATVQVIIQN